MNDHPTSDDLHTPGPEAAGGDRQAPSRSEAPYQAPPGPPPAYAQPYATAPPPPMQPAVDPRDPRIKSPVLASILSAVPGLGQIYVGYYVRGFAHAITLAALISIAVAIDPYGDTLAPVIGMFSVFFWLYNIIDAGRKASLYNLALQGRATDIELPADFSMPAFKGSIGAGLLLIAFGFAVLLHTKWNVSLQWVTEWWPVLPIGVGVWLIVKAIQDRADR